MKPRPDRRSGLWLAAMLCVALIARAAAAAPIPQAWSAAGCTAASCHGGIEPIRERSTGMMKAIVARGGKVGDPDGCVVCHGGDPGAETAEEAHRGSPAPLEKLGGPGDFLADPASPWVNERTCGQCHMELVRAQWSSLMMSEAGKIQGTTWSFGSMESYDHTWANYAYENPEDPGARLGTDAYRAYMADKATAHPNVFVSKHTPLPPAPDEATLDSLHKQPGAAAFTYLRTECQRCHLGVKGRARRGDYRGMGCGACHVPYGNEGVYEGADATIPTDEGGHPLVHRIQASRNATVHVGAVEYRGIPVETCTTCHNRGKRIGVSYQGLMESAFGSPYTEGGGGQIALHTKHYLAMEKDIHYQRGMLCQDCHTSGDVHGDRFIAGANLGAVEIECTDCHGTPTAYPWELPLGYGDENGPGARSGPGRGVATSIPKHVKKQPMPGPEDGYVLTARGNPMPDVVRRGQSVVVRTVAGRDLTLEPLKLAHLEGKLSVEARTAMVNVSKHVDTMECYTCHTSWAPQCYGCHVKVDYREGKQSFDWVAAGQKHQKAEFRRDRGEPYEDVMVPGEVTETRSYLRWEDPPLGVNGEGRVSPLIPGCQPSVTIIGRDGEEIVRNWIFKTEPGSEGAGEDGQLGADMSPVHPHTVGKSRTCESCHASDKALGYGIAGTRRDPPWSADLVVDLETADGKTIPGSARPQIEGIEHLEQDWSAVVTPDGKQLQTVGHHFRGSGPLSNEQRANMDRRGVCVSCHQEIPAGTLAISALHHAADMLKQLPDNREKHDGLVHGIAMLAAWVEVGGGLGALTLAAGGSVWVLHRRRKRRRSPPAPPR